MSKSMFTSLVPMRKEKGKDTFIQQYSNISKKLNDIIYQRKNMVTPKSILLKENEGTMITQLYS